ncbi:MAG: protein kinase [Kofleriaceae bacterium]
MGAPPDPISAVDPTAQDDTLAASEDVAASVPPRVRGASASGPDYPQLTPVDPAHYVIEREIARGGMGRILVARDRRLGRAVAVKETLRASGRVARRFEREARITARLQHPSIISVHEAGTWPSGEPFYAMRLVTGRSLDEVIAAAPTYADRLALLPNLLAVADAMAYAHGEGVIHRDLKPRNIVVGAFGETVVLDWGLAKELGSAALTSSRDGDASGDRLRGDADTTASGETVDGEVLGTPAYMPPEQANGAAVDARADVYAIGAILYHVLTGRAPFVAASNAELLAAVHSGPPAPVTDAVPEAATELVAICQRAMARDPDARYPTALALAEDLRRFQTGQLVGAHRYSLRQLLWRRLRQHRTGLAATAAALVVALVIGVVAIRRVVAAEGVAQRQRAAALASRGDAEELMQFMLGDFRDKLDGLGRLDLLEDVAQRALAYYERRGATTDAATLATADARLLLADNMSARGDPRSALAEADRAATLLADLTARHPDDVALANHAADVALFIAKTQVELGQWAEATARFRQVLTGSAARRARDPADAAALRQVMQATNFLSGLAQQQGDTTAAMQGYREVLAQATELVRLQPGARSEQRLLSAHSDLAALDLETGALPEALTHYREALAIGQRLLAAEPARPLRLSDVALSHSEIADVLLAQHEAAAALAELAQAVPLAERAIAVDPSNTRARGMLVTLFERTGMAKAALGDRAGALAAYTDAAAIARELLAKDPTNPESLRSVTLMDNKLGDTQVADGHPALAVPHYQAALQIRAELVERDPTNLKWRRDLFYSHYKLGMAHRAAGDHANAKAAFAQAVAVAAVTHAARPDNDRFATDLAETQGELGTELRALGDAAGARAAYAAGLEVARAMAARADADPAWAGRVRELEAGLAGE